MLDVIVKVIQTPFVAVRSVLPFNHQSRQTLIYLVFAGAGPALTVTVIWAMLEALERPKLWSTFSHLSLIVASAMLVIVVGLGMFVSIRAVRIGKDGFEASGGGANALPDRRGGSDESV
jgi:hypothetical protein